MSKTVVWKFPLTYKEATIQVEIPEVFQLLYVDAQGELPCVWAEVVPDRKTIHLKFFVIATGETMSENFTAKYVGSCQTRAGLMFHVYVQEQADDTQ